MYSTPFHTLRAIRACDNCRRQKTRCFPSEGPTPACLRCLTLKRACTFANNSQQGDLQEVKMKKPAKTKTTQKVAKPAAPAKIGFKELKDDIVKILSLLESQKQNHNEDQVSMPPQKLDEEILNPNASSTPAENAPFQTIQSSVKDPPLPISLVLAPNLLNLTAKKIKHPTIITLGIITQDQAIEMIDWYKLGYDRWVLVSKTYSSEKLVNLLSKSCPLLLTVVCITGLRYTTCSVDAKCFKALVIQMKVELFRGLSDQEQSFDFLKAMVLIAIYGYSFSTEDYIIDPWFISNLCVSYFSTLNVRYNFHSINMSKMYQRMGYECEVEDLAVFRTWNHICLTHLTNCVFSGRLCVLDEIRLDQSRRILNLSQSTNFDGRIISEISLQLILYNYIQSWTNESSSFQHFEQDIKSWHGQWSYLFEQPYIQFVELAYHYCYVVAIYHHQMSSKGLVSLESSLRDNTHKIEDEAVLNELIDHCVGLMNHINSSTLSNDYFAYLSDQIHVCSFYVSVIFLKTLDWSKDFNSQYDTTELFELLNLVEKLRVRFKQITKRETDISSRYEAALGDGVARLKNRLST